MYQSGDTYIITICIPGWWFFNITHLKKYDRQNGLESSPSFGRWNPQALLKAGFGDSIRHSWFRWFEASLMCLVRRWSSRLVSLSCLSFESKKGKFYMRRKAPEKQGSWWSTNPNHALILKGNPSELPYKWPVWNHQNHIGKMPSKQAKFPPKPEPVGCFAVVASRFGWLRKKRRSSKVLEDFPCHITLSIDSIQIWLYMYLITYYDMISQWYNSILIENHM